MTALEARDTISLSYVQQSLIHEEQKLNGDSKLDGSDAGDRTGQALTGKHEPQKGGRYQHKKVCAICVGSLDIFVGIVQRIEAKNPSLPARNLIWMLKLMNLKEYLELRQRVG